MPSEAGLWLSRSSEAEHRPLLAPGERQTRVRQQLVRSQIARLAPVEDGLRDVRGEIAEADQPCEIGPADAFPLPLGECRKRHTVAADKMTIRSFYLRPRGLFVSRRRLGARRRPRSGRNRPGGENDPYPLSRSRPCRSCMWRSRPT